MTKLTITTALIAVSIFSAQVNASNSYALNKKKHTVGLKTTFGSIKANSIPGEDGDVKLSLTPYYQYRLSKHWATSLDYITGSSENTQYQFHDIVAPNKYDYKAAAWGVKGFTPIAERWSVYGQLSYLSYRLENTRIGYNNPFDVVDGSGYMLNAGIEFRADNGFGAGFEYSSVDMGDITVNGLGIAINYTF